MLILTVLHNTSSTKSDGIQGSKENSQGHGEPGHSRAISLSPALTRHIPCNTRHLWEYHPWLRKHGGPILVKLILVVKLRRKKFGLTFQNPGPETD